MPATHRPSWGIVMSPITRTGSLGRIGSTRRPDPPSKRRCTSVEMMMMIPMLATIVDNDGAWYSGRNTSRYNTNPSTAAVASASTIAQKRPTSSPKS